MSQDKKRGNETNKGPVFFSGKAEPNPYAEETSQEAILKRSRETTYKTVDNSRFVLPPENKKNSEEGKILVGRTKFPETPAQLYKFVPQDINLSYKAGASSPK